MPRRFVLARNDDSKHAAAIAAATRPPARKTTTVRRNLHSRGKSNRGDEKPKERATEKKNRRADQDTDRVGLPSRVAPPIAEQHL
jgi:hypothetical protein